VLSHRTGDPPGAVWVVDPTYDFRTERFLGTNRRVRVAARIAAGDFSLMTMGHKVGDCQGSVAGETGWARATRPENPRRETAKSQSLAITRHFD
jgi:hypothetical protein